MNLLTLSNQTILDGLTSDEDYKEMSKMAQVTYNDTTCEISGKFSQSHSVNEYIFDGVIQIMSSTGIASTVANLEDKLRQINKSFSLKFDGSTVLSYSHSDNTGFLARPTLTKIPNDLSTGNTREYNFQVAIQLPDEEHGQLKDASYIVDYSDIKRKTITISANYTAGSLGDAPTTYAASFPALIALILARYPVGTAYEKQHEKVDVEKELKVLTVRVVYKEVIYTQYGAIDNADIIDPQLNLSLSYQQEGGKGIITGESSSRGAVATASGSVSMDLEHFGDVTNFDTYYRNTLRPYALESLDILILSGVGDDWGTNRYTTADEYHFDVYKNRILFTLSFYIPIGKGIQYVAYKEEYTIKTNANESFKHIWDGKDHNYSVYSPGKELFVSRALSCSKLDGEPSLPAPLTVALIPQVAQDGKGALRFITDSVKRSIKLVGNQANNGYSAEVHFMGYSDMYRYVRESEEKS